MLKIGVRYTATRSRPLGWLLARVKATRGHSAYTGPVAGFPSSPRLTSYGVSYSSPPRPWGCFLRGGRIKSSCARALATRRRAHTSDSLALVIATRSCAWASETLAHILINAICAVEFQERFVLLDVASGRVPAFAHDCSNSVVRGASASRTHRIGGLEVACETHQTRPQQIDPAPYAS